ncbi:hypothetical protein M9458_009306, partial [Cirrhinus mrigala]
MCRPGARVRVQFTNNRRVRVGFGSHFQIKYGSGSVPCNKFTGLFGFGYEYLDPMLWAEEFLFNIQQAERPLEQYVEEFLNVLYLVSLSDAMINTCFQMGQNYDKLFCSITSDDCRKPVAEFINHVLALCHSNYYVDVKDSNLSPIWEHAAAPAHHQPASSMCCSNEHTPSPPSLTPVLQSSSLILSPEPAASSRTPAAASSWTRATVRSQTPALASLRTPATPLRSGLPAANMTSHINIKDIMDSCGLFSPVSPSSPKSPLVPSIPPEHPPEPELPPERPPESSFLQSRPPEPELPPEHPPEPVPPEHTPGPAPPERPPGPAPPERPPGPAPPERPPEPVPPEHTPGPAPSSWGCWAGAAPADVASRAPPQQDRD